MAVNPIGLDVGAACGCGSGLPPRGCCALDWAAMRVTSAPGGELGQVRAGFAAGNAGHGERRLLDTLRAYPFDLAALRVLRDLRATQGKAGAVEALNARIVRLDPNDVAATQALALALFGRGALAE